MKCPVCKEPDLIMSERQGIEIDYCPTCRGVWLDRGELDKIVEKSSEATPARSVAGSVPPPGINPYGEGHGHYDDHHKHDGHHGYRRKSWLGDLFD
jgi:Zn-finger nucleic acid-binding protein